MDWFLYDNGSHHEKINDTTDRQASGITNDALVVLLMMTLMMLPLTTLKMLPIMTLPVLPVTVLFT